MILNNEAISEAVESWVLHSGRHSQCYYIDSEDAGTEQCPGEFAVLRDYLEYCGHSVPRMVTSIAGVWLDRPYAEAEVAPVVQAENEVTIRLNELTAAVGSLITSLESMVEIQRTTTTTLEKLFDMIKREQESSGWWLTGQHDG